MDSNCEHILEEYKSCIKSIHLSETNISKCSFIWSSLLKCYKELEYNNKIVSNDKSRGKNSRL